MLSPLLFAIVADVITENARRGVVKKLLYEDDSKNFRSPLRRCDSNSCFDFLFYLAALVSFA